LGLPRKLVSTAWAAMLEAPIRRVLAKCDIHSSLNFTKNRKIYIEGDGKLFTEYLPIIFLGCKSVRN
jgi:hypothetical protein